MELLTDIAHGVVQYMSWPDHRVGKMPPGGLCERVNMSDWEGTQNVGGNIFASCAWVETAAMLTISQLPGLYVQPDTGVFTAFDSIRAEKISHAKGVLWLRLTNPTKFAADVKVLAESANDARKQQPFLTSPQIRVIHLDAGAVSEEEFR